LGPELTLYRNRTSDLATFPINCPALRKPSSKLRNIL
jgi:hypothetical protein